MGQSCFLSVYLISVQLIVLIWEQGSPGSLLCGFNWYGISSFKVYCKHVRGPETKDVLNNFKGREVKGVRLAQLTRLCKACLCGL